MRCPVSLILCHEPAMISNVSNVNLVKDQVDLYLDIPMDQFGMSDSKIV